MYVFGVHLPLDAFTLYPECLLLQDFFSSNLPLAEQKVSTVTILMRDATVDEEKIHAFLGLGSRGTYSRNSYT